MSITIHARRPEDREWLLTPLALSLLIHLVLFCLIIGSGLFGMRSLKEIVDVRFRLKDVKREVPPPVQEARLPLPRELAITPTAHLPGGVVGDIEKAGIVSPPKATPEIVRPKGDYPESPLPVLQRPSVEKTSPQVVAEGIKAPEVVGPPLKVSLPVAARKISSLLPGPARPLALRFPEPAIEAKKLTTLSGLAPHAPVEKAAAPASPESAPELGILVAPVIATTPGEALAAKLPPASPQTLAPLPTTATKQPLEPFVDIRFTTYKDPNDPRRYFRLEIRTREDKPLPVIPKDVLVSVDVSVSIKTAELEEARSALAASLATLNPGDRFNVIRFSERVWKLFPDFVPATDENVRRAVAYSDRIPHETMTDVYSAIQTVVSAIPKSNRPCNVYLISDGSSTMGIRSLRKIVNDFAVSLRPEISFFVFDSGSDGNLFLLDLVAYKSRGAFVHADRVKGSSAALGELFRRFNQPVLFNIAGKYAGLNVDEVYPEVLPNLFRGEPIVIHGRCAPEDEALIYLWGQDAEGFRDFRHPVELDKAETGDESIAKEWARGKIHHLASQIARHGPRPEWREEISRLAKKHGVSVPSYLR